MSVSGVAAQSGGPLGWYQVLKETSNGVVQGAPWKELVLGNVVLEIAGKAT